MPRSLVRAVVSLERAESNEAAVVACKGDGGAVVVGRAMGGRSRAAVADQTVSGGTARRYAEDLGSPMPVDGDEMNRFIAVQHYLVWPNLMKTARAHEPSTRPSIAIKLSQRPGQDRSELVLIVPWSQESNGIYQGTGKCETK